MRIRDLNIPTLLILTALLSCFHLSCFPFQALAATAEASNGPEGEISNAAGWGDEEASGGNAGSTPAALNSDRPAKVRSVTRRVRHVPPAVARLELLIKIGLVATGALAVLILIGPALLFKTIRPMRRRINDLTEHVGSIRREMERLRDDLERRDNTITRRLEVLTRRNQGYGDKVDRASKQMDDVFTIVSELSAESAEKTIGQDSSTLLRAVHDYSRLSWKELEQISSVLTTSPDETNRDLTILDDINEHAKSCIEWVRAVYQQGTNSTPSDEYLNSAGMKMREYYTNLAKDLEDTWGDPSRNTDDPLMRRIQVLHDRTEKLASLCTEELGEVVNSYLSEIKGFLSKSSPMDGLSDQLASILLPKNFADYEAARFQDETSSLQDPEHPIGFQVYDYALANPSENCLSFYERQIRQLIMEMAGGSAALSANDTTNFFNHFKTRRILELIDHIESRVSADDPERREIENAVRSILNALGLEEITVNITGQEYDPRTHQKVATQKSNYPQNTIVQVKKRGIKDRDGESILRKPLVVVSD
ncbi:nucleotide exchange factor GrpE [Thermodesulfobacteriota bacterium]